MTNRIIKFRAWDIDWKNNSGNQGKMLAWDNSPSMFPLQHYLLMKTKYLVMQFTGLLDKNGKEIYEGDIITIANAPYIFEVIWDTHDAAFSFKGTRGQIGDPNGSFQSGYKIIGNIYENPELLK